MRRLVIVNVCMYMYIVYPDIRWWACAHQHTHANIFIRSIFFIAHPIPLPPFQLIYFFPGYKTTYTYHRLVYGYTVCMYVQLHVCIDSRFLERYKHSEYVLQCARVLCAVEPMLRPYMGCTNTFLPSLGLVQGMFARLVIIFISSFKFTLYSTLVMRGTSFMQVLMQHISCGGSLFYHLQWLYFA